MKVRLLSAGVLALSLIASPSQADVDVGIFFSGAAIHGNGFSLYLGGPYSYAPYGYLSGRSRHYHSRGYSAPRRHYSAPRHHYRPRHYDRSPSYRHDYSRPGYKGHSDGRRRFDGDRSYRRSGGGDYRYTRSGSGRHDGHRQFFRSGDGRRH
ncbi:hypothetical protein [Marinobacterium aestuarii]|uniref:hypothetical protein n=1 Tax=Marinobacterium aestuarii TaxID=1821621 RepID=UPI000AAF6D6B|nr:hypothetical protein [Marinobacterium aestuarii]